MQKRSTKYLTSSNTDILHAAKLLDAGELVSFPTETVYGLGADARNSTAVAQVFQAKGRPHFNPLIVHVSSTDAAETYVEWSGTARILAEAFWPGPMTLVMPLKVGHGLSPLVTSGLSTLAIRVPAHPTAQSLLAAFGGPVAAPSANPSGRISPTTAAHVKAGLGGRISAILDDGPCDVGVESTIVGLQPVPTLLREGGVTREEIEAVLGYSLKNPADSAVLTAPGQMSSHYAPKASVRLNATDANPGEVLLGFGNVKGDLNLSPSGDLAQAAARLFDYLHQMDAADQLIAIAPIPDVGLGRAINDRLKRAAAPR